MSLEVFPRRYEAELARQRYYQHRNAQASRSHTKTRRKWFEQQGIDVDKIKSIDWGANS